MFGFLRDKIAYLWGLLSPCQKPNRKDKIMKGTVLFWSGILGVFCFVITTLLAGLQFPDYSHLSQLISESYAIDTPYGRYLRFLGFLPSGLFIAVFSFLAIKALPKSLVTQVGFWGMGIFYGLATVLVSFFPCDQGCNPEMIDPSLSQIIHNLTGFLTYMIVPFSLLLLGIAARKWTNGQYLSNAGIICGLIAIIFVGILTSDLHGKFAGLYQRIIEGSILFWISLCAFYFNNITHETRLKR